MALPLTDTRTLTDLIRFAGKSVLVTGGAKGIGRGIALRFAEAGAHVMIADVDEAAGTDTARACEQKGTAAGAKARFVRADLAKVDDARGAVKATVDAFGRIDVAVNNAGIFPPKGALDIDEALWDRVLDVNLKGAFFLAQEAARAMTRAKSPGAIVNIASIDAFQPSGNLTHYDASKGAMVMMTKSLAMELAPLGIRVNAVAPGSITTPGANDVMGSFAGLVGLTADQMRAGYIQKIPGGRMGSPDDIALTTLFLASDLAAYIVGQTLIVDGGLLLT